ncbi:hypothetical protein A8W25_22235 [Streptomyces sp. ERV7]|uniref:hypothetical protein n=1 Tax=Streptomyces sp. ERV7 TaxID=1322334 RepID=UPI0007F5563A|nr:hypothetical protein [Streptomyces sp. ERV7]OAR22376.1 hypothetical protein A8W25_22235 [Streptomyces sp. ERV7]
MPEALLALPVYLTVGDHTVKIGELALAPGEAVHNALAAFFRDVAAACEASTEGGDDGTA